MKELKEDKEFKEFITPLTESEFEELEKSVLSEGIRDAICVWNGIIIDGHHRYQLAKKHNLDFEVKEYDFPSKDAVKLWMISNQLGRRNLNRMQAIDLCLGYKDLIAKQVREKSSDNDTILPEIKAISKKDLQHTTREVIAEMATKIAGGDKVGHGTVYHLEEAKKKKPELYNDILSGKTTLSKVSKEIRKEKKLEEIAERHKNLASKFKSKDGIQIVNADFYPWCKENLEENSVDVIITDPPYPKEFLHVWEQLSEVASKVLKPGGYLVTYSGQLYFGHVIDALRKHLELCWMVCLHHTQATQLVHARKIVCTWKPIIILRKGSVGQVETDSGHALVDSIMDDYREKEFHEWGQGESAVAYLMKSFTNPGDLVLDPFAGGGTTLAVAKILKRKCIGIEIDKKYIDTIKANVMKTGQEKIKLDS